MLVNIRSKTTPVCAICTQLNWEVSVGKQTKQMLRMDTAIFYDSTTSNCPVCYRFIKHKQSTQSRQTQEENE